LKNTITGTSPDFALDFSKVLISRGKLPNADNVAAIAAGGNKVNFTWQKNLGLDIARDKDKAIVVVHCPILNRSQFAITTAVRTTEIVSVDVSAFSGFTVHTWIGFLSENGNEVATSLYTGSLVVV